MVLVIDLDDLEVRCADGQKWLHDWYDGGGAPTPETVAALVRVVRAAMELCGVDADGTQYAAADEHGDLIREHLIPALKPFRPGDS